MRIFVLFGNSIRSRLATKMVVSVAGMALVLLVILSVAVDFRTSSALEAEISEELVVVAELKGDELGSFLAEQVQIVRAMASTDANLLAALRARNRQYTGKDAATIEQELIALDDEWRAAAESTSDLIERTINNATARKFRTFSEEFPAHVEIFVTDRYGAEFAGSGRTSDYYQADEDWWQAAWNDGAGAVFLSSPVFDESIGALSIEISIPIVDPETGEVLGILKDVYIMSALIDRIEGVVLGETGEIELIDANGNFVASGEEFEETGVAATDAELLDGRIFTGIGSDLNAKNTDGESIVVGYAPLNSDGDVPEIDQLGWVVKVEQDSAEALAPIQEERIILAGLTAVSVVVFGLLALFLARSLLQGLSTLTRVSNQLGEGDFSVRANVQSRDEIGQLAESFNDMASLIQTRDAELAARLQDLQTAFDVNEQISTTFDLDRLLQDVTDLTKERFELYHAHIYVFDPEQQLLTLTAGAGHVGRQMVAEIRTIGLENQASIVAQAARTRSSVAVADVRASATFLPHRLLPNTRSEFAVALVARGQLLGVLDVQADEVDYFAENVVEVLELMAGQIASAISNAYLYTTAERASRFEQAIGRLDRQLQDAVNIDEILQATVRELGKALRVSNTAIELSLEGWTAEEIAAVSGNGHQEVEIVPDEPSLRGE